MLDVPATLNTDPPALATGAKVVGSEGPPVITSVLVIAALTDGWQLLVDHLHFWPLSPNLFTLAGFALFFLLRKDSSGFGRAMPEATAPKPPKVRRAPPDPTIVKRAADEAADRTARYAAEIAVSHPGPTRQDVADTIIGLSPLVPDSEKTPMQAVADVPPPDAPSPPGPGPRPAGGDGEAAAKESAS